MHSITRFDGTTVQNEYDGQARLTLQAHPGLTNAFTYTPGGRLVTATGGGVTLSNSFDGFYRLSAQHRSGVGPSQIVEYTWYPDGSVSNIVTAAGTWAHEYDPAGRLLSQTTPLGSEYSWTYNQNNGRMHQRTHETGHTSTFLSWL